MQTPLTEIDPHTAAANWLERFQAALDRGDARAAAAYFLPGGHWRDLVAFGSHILTMNGTAEIAAAFRRTLPAVRPRGFRIAAERTPPRLVTRAGTPTVEAIVAFETAIGRGSGVLRLVPDPAADGGLAAWVLLTALDELTGHEERIGDRRAGNEAYSRKFGGDNWLDHRERPAPMPITTRPSW